MKTTKIYTLLALLMVFALSCNKPDEPNNGGGNNDVTVTVTTFEPCEITATTAVCGAEVTVSDGVTCAELGVCWSTNATPTVEFSHLSTENSDGHFTCTVEGLEPDTKYYVCAYAKCGQECYYGDIKSFTTLTGLDSHDYVDFGLPSGTLWAKCNIGANAPEEYGDYFAWGETESRIFNSNPFIGWTEYKYGCGFYSVSKYTDTTAWNCTGIIDNLTILEPCDDAAMVNWGEGWRMPTWDDWRELNSNVSSSWATMNSVKGILLVANGDTLFLPAAGLNNGNLADTACFYWSSTLGYSISYETGDYSSIPYQAYTYSKNINNVGSYSPMVQDRYLGFSVRPVRSVE